MIDSTVSAGPAAFSAVSIERRARAARYAAMVRSDPHGCHLDSVVLAVEAHDQRRVVEIDALPVLVYRGKTFVEAAASPDAQAAGPGPQW